MSEPESTNTPARWLIAALLSLLLAVSFVPFSGDARAQQESAVLAFAPSPATLRSGESATVEVRISNAQRLFGADIEVAFDPAVAAIVDADPTRDGVQVRIGPLLEPGFVVYNNAENATGKLRVAFTQVAPRPAATGDGTLLTIELRAVGGGAPRLRVTAALLARDDGSAQPVVISATGSTPAAPSGSPVPNPTQIPEPTTTPQPTPAAGAAKAAISPAATPPAGGTTAEAHRPADVPTDDASDDDLPVAWMVGGLAVVAAVGVVLGQRHIKRNGVTK